jgi:DNA-binding transcriptional LysR family regulator
LLKRTFVLDIGAGFDAILLPTLAAELSLVAPGVRLLVSNARAGDLLAELRHGETQLAFDFKPVENEEIRCERLAQGASVVLARPDHPALADGLTKELYFKLSHVELVWARSTKVSGVAVELERMRRQRQVAISAPTLMVAAGVAAASDHVATVSDFVANVLAKHFRLTIHPLPFSLPPIALCNLWHSRFDDDVAHRWLRGTIRGVVQRLSKPLPTRV